MRRHVPAGVPHLDHVCFEAAYAAARYPGTDISQIRNFEAAYAAARAFSALIDEALDFEAAYAAARF